MQLMTKLISKNMKYLRLSIVNTSLKKYKTNSLIKFKISNAEMS